MLILFSLENKAAFKTAFQICFLSLDLPLCVALTIHQRHVVYSFFIPAAQKKVEFHIL